jgi:hypothetical protein
MGSYERVGNCSVITNSRVS